MELWLPVAVLSAADNAGVAVAFAAMELLELQ